MANITFERVIELSLFITMAGCCLPLINPSSKFKVICHKIVRYLGFLNHLVLATALLHTSYKNADQSSLVIPSILLACICLCGNVQVIVCEIYSHQLEMVIIELQRYSKLKDPLITRIIQGYIDKYFKFYVGFVLFVSFSGATFVIGPFIMSQPLPTQAEYPLPMEKPWVRVLLHIHQNTATLQCASQISLSTFCALLIWYAAARFDVLAEKFKMSVTLEEIKERINEHQYLLWLTQEIIDVTKYNILAELTFGTIRIVFGALYFMRPQPWAERAQFLVVNFMALYSSFSVIWPSDFLLNLNENIQNACYESKWYEQSGRMQKNLLIIMLSCGKRLSLSVGFILRDASLEFYRRYVSTAVSYFTVLHVLFDAESS